jgi:hypothetical protein
MLPTFGVPRGAVWLGTELARRGADPALARSGLVAVTLGRVGLGQLDTAAATARRLRDAATDPATRAFSIGLPAALALAESDSLPRSAAEALAKPLEALLDPEAIPPAERHGAALLVGLLGVAGGSDSLVDLAGRILADEPAPGSLRRAIDAARQARAGRADQAAEQAALIVREPTTVARSVFLRGLLSLDRARWLAGAGRQEAALVALLWFQHSDVAGTLTGSPIAAEFDWALNTLGRWRTARLEDPVDRKTEACKDYAAVARDWAAADAPLKARADTARREAARLGCR